MHWSAVARAWVLSPHADVDAVLRDHRSASNDPRKRTLTPRQAAGLRCGDQFSMILLDQPAHTRLRVLVNKAFTKRAVDAIATRFVSSPSVFLT